MAEIVKMHECLGKKIDFFEVFSHEGLNVCMYVVTVTCFGGANMISENEHIALSDAFEKWYNSIWYKRLLNYDTLLYRESAGYVYELYKSFN